MGTAGLLLTGGHSRRMGRAKASLRLVPTDSPHQPSETLARRTATLLSGLTEPALEVGPGYTTLVTVRERSPGRGPLAAVACGAAALAGLGWEDPVLVIATDFPAISVGLLTWLVREGRDRSVVPLADGHPQPLCAVYRFADLARAAELQRVGQSSMRDLVAAVDPWMPDEQEWGPAAGDVAALRDVDTPDDLRQLGWTVVE